MRTLRTGELHQRFVQGLARQQPGALVQDSRSGQLHDMNHTRWVWSGSARSWDTTEGGVDGHVILPAQEL